MTEPMTEPMIKPMIEIERVTKAYDGRRVVDELSLSVPPGSLCVLLGPSGCGKSTTLRMINRLIAFDSGAIRVGGEDVRQVPPEVLRRRIGYAIQSIGLFPHWRVEDNIATVPRLLGWPRSQVRDRVSELLLLLRLDPESYRSKYPHQLSGGEQQRVGVARALAADPDLLLMDEPFAALDPVTRGALQGEILRIQRATKKTVVFVTHDIEEALVLASDIAILERGRLAQWGTPIEILERPASPFVAEFVGGAANGLKLMSLRTVAERLHPGEPAEGEALVSNTSLRDALAAMAAGHTDRLPVVDHAGRPLGAITLADLVR
jgi:osmoprotectant transport system ATP-binding protein